MRKKWQKQMTFMPQEIDHPQARELEAISQLLDSKSTIYEIVLQDLPSQAISGSPRGARGMTAEQVIRAAIVKVLFGFTYEELAFHLIDSMSIRRFCRIGLADEGFKKSTLYKNIKALSADTWQLSNREVLASARKQPA